MQLRVTGTHEEYVRAAELLWGTAGRYAVESFARLNRDLFGDELPLLPIVIGLTAYGRCGGLTRPPDEFRSDPRITLASTLCVRRGLRSIDDTLVHEMVHAVLMLRGEKSEHNDAPWCEMITKLSPDVLGHDIVALPVRNRRVPNPTREHDPKAPKTISIRPDRPDVPGALSRDELAHWPHSVRPDGYYANDERIHVPTY